MSKKNNLLISGALAGLVLGVNMLARKARYMDFNRKVVLITGGSRGLGLVIARQLIKENALLAICSRDPEELENAKNELLKKGARDVVALQCDIRNKDEVNAMVKHVEDYYGRIDVLINNAAVIGVGGFEDMTEADYEETMSTIFWGSLYAIRAVFPGMKKRQAGRIVNISSIGGKIAVPHMLPYSASKFALSGLSQGLRSELKKYGIIVTTVFPGLMRTGSHYNVDYKGKHEEEYKWFSESNLNPMVSSGAEQSAAKIIQAVKNGDADLSFPANTYITTRLNAIFPNISADFLTLFDSFLPAPGGVVKKKGFESITPIPEVFENLGEKAAVNNNEV